MKRIGLTGGPGCGKSAVLNYFSSVSGWQCLDADRICHEIYEEAGTPFGKRLAARWGAEIISENGTPDRARIAQKIFDDETERQWLNSVLHPEVLLRLETAMARIRDKDFVMIEAPLLFEAQWSFKMNAIVAVWSAPEIQMERLLARGWTREHAEKRIRSQFPADKKLELADYGLINNGSLESLLEQCAVLEKTIRNNFR
ncbi:MAG: Dephospho-CoA kinase [Lentisphaerae bacterium ADurb.Bin242]|nr:MAG: Dephospho-CoA kinase [Lentisphaerae bacterium ADurb.Bin242]